MPSHLFAESSTKDEAVLAAALGCFAARGFHGTAVPEIARAARVGTGTIYRHFADKRALVNAVYQRCKRALAVALLRELPADAAPRESFHHLWQALADFARDEPEALDFLELHHHQAYLDDASRALELAVLQPIVEVLVAARAQGVAKDAPPEVLISMAWGAFVGLLKASRQGFLSLSDANVAAAEACAWDLLARPPGGS